MSVVSSSLVVLIYLMALASFISYLRSFSHRALAMGRLVLCVGVLAQIFFLNMTLGQKQSWFPTNPQESYVFTTTILAAASFLLSWRKSSISVLLVLLPLIAGILIAFQFYRPPQADGAELPPWIWIHIILMLLGEALFLVCGAISVVYLLAEKEIRQRNLRSVFTRFVSLNVLERLLGEVLAVGFVLLSVGLILGVIFASSLWDGHWYLDPKFLVCVLTWVVFAGLLILRWKSESFRGRRSAQAACVGVLLVIFLVLGVEALFETQHLNFSFRLNSGTGLL